MKVFVPTDLQRALVSAPEGSLIRGTLSLEHGIATITALVADHQRASDRLYASTSDLLVAYGDSTDAIRPIIAAVGSPGNALPLWVACGEPPIWRACTGQVVDVIEFETQQFFKRTPFDPLLCQRLRQEKLLIIGIGSVGASMGLELAKTGIGGLVAVDNDSLEIHNGMRHVLGTAYVGWPKATAFAHFLKEQAPACQCIAVNSDLFQGSRAQLRELMEETRPTRILAVTDSLRIQYLCQRLALHYQLPLMAVWCDNNAVEGEIFMWEPGQARAWKAGRPERGCYACLRDPDQITLTRSSSFDYSSDNPDSYGGEPALGSFINRINTIATIFMTAWMLADSPVPSKLAGILDEFYEGKGLQYIRLGGPYPFQVEGQITAKAPWAVEWYRVRKNPVCSHCNDRAINASVLFPEPGATPTGPDSFESFAALDASVG